MSREVFVDTSAWIAISDAGDKYHSPARAAYTALLKERRTLVTTNLVIAETYILIRRRGGHSQAMRWLQSVNGSPRLRKVNSDAGLEARAVALLAKYVDQDYSYTDAVSFVVIEGGRDRGGIHVRPALYDGGDKSDWWVKKEGCGGHINILFHCRYSSKSLLSERIINYVSLHNLFSERLF